MATTFKEIEEYIKVNWRNYNPPSIDQINLLHIEDNIELNRNTINEIIKRLGSTPEGSVSVENQKIYDDSIYDTLISHKDLIKQLDNDKVDKTTYNTDKTNLQNQINNRLRKDMDDVSQFGYTFKKLTLTETLSVGTTTTLSGAVTAGSTMTVAGKLTANSGFETTTIKASGAVTLTNSLSVSKGATIASGATITGGAKITGTLTVDNLVVTGGISCNGAGTFGGDISCKNLTANASIQGQGLTVKNNYISFGDGARKLYVQNSVPSLGGGDAVITTVN